LKQLSEVAHHVEDLLDRMAETKCGADTRIVSLLQTSTACLRSLTNGDMSAELVRSISQLYYDFDGVLASLHELPTAAAPPAQTQSLLAETERAVVTADEIDPGIAERVFAVPRSSYPGVRSAPGKSVVRVSLERLDDLVRIVRDMLISRSVFEQNLKSMERQIDDLHNATRRLQTTSSKLEIDFEASLMGAGATFLAKGPGSASGTPGGFDELEFDQYTEFHESTRDLAETTNDAFSINASLDLLRGGFESVLDEQRRLVDDLQHRLMQIRMVEFGALTSRMQRAVRVTCEEENKKAEIKITNESLAIDTQILDSLIEPLVHLLKNSVVHGIELPETRRLLGKPETGVINVSVENDETHIVLTVSDDGNGISAEAIKEKAITIGQLTREDAGTLSNEEALELIFLPGLTTAEKLNLSAGRGVGMSIVKESIAAGRGSIFIESTYQQGTTFTIRMPLALAVTKVLLAKVGGRSYALPLKQITYITELRDELFSGIDGKKVEILGKKLPLLQLSAFLGNEPVPAAALLGKTALLYESAERSCALAVENVDRAEEVVIKPLAQPLDRIKGLLGAAILGNGDLVPILDMPALLKKRVDRQVKLQQPAVAVTKDRAVTVLIVDDSPSVRHMTSKVIQAAGWIPKTAKDGLDALEQLKASEELPAIILSDIEMPRMDGYEFAASLQRSEDFTSIPVIMITSRTADKHREKAIENGVSQYLTKPYEDRELIDSIKILANLT
jgi:chemosensory pili system protein ChpA (sensor histidine kinase/response regulator)